MNYSMRQVYESFYRDVFVRHVTMTGRLSLATGGIVALAGLLIGLSGLTQVVLWVGLGILGWGLVSLGIAVASHERVDMRDIARRYGNDAERFNR